MTTKFIKNYLKEVSLISSMIDQKKIHKLINEIYKVKKKRGRIFFLGVGGSAGNCSHAVNDFRKLCNIESYTPIDNVSEITARINDEGWNSSLSKWLSVSNLNKNDAIFIFSVGGGDLKKKISVNLIEAVKYAKKKNSKIFSITGRKTSYVKQNSNCAIVIPIIDIKRITPHSEAFQAVIWHLLVSHPLLKSTKTKW